MAEASSSQGDTGKAGVSGKAVGAGLGAAAVAVGTAAAGKKAATDDDTNDTASMDVGVPLAAMPTETGAADTSPMVKEMFT